MPDTKQKRQDSAKSSEPTLTITSEVKNHSCSTGEAAQLANLEDIVMPDTKPKGRPPGRVLMAIGLPIKKGPVSFIAQWPVVQAKMILQWLISDEQIIQNALTGEYLIREADIPSDDKGLPDSIMADEVDLGVLSHYYEKRALQKLTKVVQKKKDLDDWRCRSCDNSLTDLSISCDACLSWYHDKCVNLKRAPKAKQWFCPSCKLSRVEGFLALLKIINMCGAVIFPRKSDFIFISVSYRIPT